MKPGWRTRATASYRLVPDLALGAAAALGQAPLSWWPVTLVALAAVLQRGACADGPRRTMLTLFMAGTGWFAVSLFWIVEPFLVDAPRHGWMAPFALLLMAAGGGLFWAVPGWLAGRIGGGPRVQVAAIALGLFLSEWLRGWIFTGFPWAMFGHVWTPTPVAQAAAWIGALGLSGLTLLLAALPGLLDPSAGTLRRGGNLSASLRPLLAPVALVGLAVALLWAAGLARLDAPVADTGHRIRLVQPNADQALKWDPDWSLVFWQRLLDESAAPPAPGSPRPDLVVWPETAVNFLLNSAGEALPLMAEAAGAPLILGIQRMEEGRYFNSLIELDRAGRVRDLYDKFHLVPFGEYIPWGEALARLGIGAFAAQQGFGYTPGPGPRLLEPQGLPAAQPLICYEAIFPQHNRAVPRPGWLLQITNDAWFGNFSGPYQHLAQARLRAIETGLPAMRAANTGVTAAIDPYGRITASLELGVSGHVDANLPQALPPTLWWRTGPAPLVLAALAGLAGLAVAARRRRG